MPAWLLPLLFAGAQGASAVGSGMQRGKERKAQEQLTREQMALERERDLRRTALDESLSDPFRHQLAQAGAVSRLDAMQNASFAPVSIDLPGRYAAFKPKMAGGFSWQPSDDVRQSAGALKQSVMAGRTAPSMTAPENYGKTATLNLLGGADPTTDAAFSMGAPVRTGLGVKPELPDRLPAAQPKGKGSRVLARKRERDIAAFESANPGWTINELNQVVRKG